MATQAAKQEDCKRWNVAPSCLVLNLIISGFDRDMNEL